MNTRKQLPGFSRSLVFLAVLGAFGAAHGEDEAISANPTVPENSVVLGVGLSTGDANDRARFGVYNGLRDSRANLLLGGSYLDRGGDSGRWTSIEARNLGLDNRDVRFTVRQLGQWKVYQEYSEITRHDPRTINTGLAGAGTAAPAVNLISPGAGSDLNLELQRKAMSLGGSVRFDNGLQLQVDFKNEEKSGARMFARGFACSATWVAAGVCTASTSQYALLLLPEPINSTMRQLDAKLTYSGDNWLLTSGYYGSFYTNEYGALTPSVPGTLLYPGASGAAAAPTVMDAGLIGALSLPMALPPDNQAHQLYVTGNYRFTPRTQATFKYSFTHATQDESFLGMGLANAPAGVSSLGGVVNTTLTQVGLTSRPTSRLSLLANVRYEDKDDRTPIALYNIENATTFTNNHNSHKRLAGKLEGSYRLPSDLRATVGVDYESMDRGFPVSTTDIAGITALRQKTEETGYRLELRRAMSETLTGAIGVSQSNRTGSDYTRLIAGFPTISGAGLSATTTTSLVVPYTMTDRERSKVKLTATWVPTDRTSLQFWVEDGKDKYDPPNPGNTAHPDKGLLENGLRFYNVDGTYALSDAWKLNAYYSRGDQTIHVNHSTGYSMAWQDLSDTFGLGFTGNPSSRYRIGGDLSYVKEKNVYEQEATAWISAGNLTALTTNGQLPEVKFQQTRIRLYGEYLLQKNASIRADLVHQRSKLDEFQWTTFVYADGSTVTADPDQSVTFLGLSWIYKFQ